jgi:hypothetical protein
MGFQNRRMGEAVCQTGESAHQLGRGRVRVQTIQREYPYHYIVIHRSNIHRKCNDGLYTRWSHSKAEGLSTVKEKGEECKVKKGRLGGLLISSS